MSGTAVGWRKAVVWVARVLSGATFLVSGWAKAVDPRGFVFKVEEYLSVWGLGDIFPEGTLGVLGSAAAIFEMFVGIMLLTGSLRRTSAICGLGMMVFWLPLTVYIAIAEPVSDCGCFGDLLVVSNGVSLAKNVVLTGLLILCLAWWKGARPLYRPSLQWLVAALTIVYGVVISLIGWHIQPVVDFRPYKIGSTLYREDEGGAALKYVYERDGVEREFDLDNLPDTTWNFVRATESANAIEGSRLSVFEGDDEVTEDLFGPDSPARQLVIVYSRPGIDDLVRSRMANEVYDYARKNGVEMVGLVAASGEHLESWKSLSRPEFEVYSSDDVSLKQLVRGPVGLVYLENGRVVWKRNFITIPTDILSYDDPIGQIVVFDDGRVAGWLSGFYIVGLLLLLTISKLTTLNIKAPKSIRKRTIEEDEQT